MVPKRLKIQQLREAGAEVQGRGGLNGKCAVTQDVFSESRGEKNTYIYFGVTYP